MTNHKLRWIEYMLRIIEPKPGLERACRDMLSERYDNAFNEGWAACNDAQAKGE